MKQKFRKDTATIVAEIHDDFTSAQDTILKEAEKILSTAVDRSIDERARRAQKLGFGKSRPAVLPKKISKKIEQAERLKTLINHYVQRYPLYKFITEEIVEKLCKKWNLVQGDAAAYTGDIPEKNLRENRSLLDAS